MIYAYIIVELLTWFFLFLSHLPWRYCLFAAIFWPIYWFKVIWEHM